jgi:hypothetical protein
MPFTCGWPRDGAGCRLGAQENLEHRAAAGCAAGADRTGVSFAMAWTMASPRPNPPPSRLRGGPALRNRSKIRSTSRRDALTAVSNGEDNVAVLTPRADLDPAHPVSAAAA